jgi:hypothetical protein
MAKLVGVEDVVEGSHLTGGRVYGENGDQCALVVQHPRTWAVVDQHPFHAPAVSEGVADEAQDESSDLNPAVDGVWYGAGFASAIGVEDDVLG